MVMSVASQSFISVSRVCKVLLQMNRMTLADDVDIGLTAPSVTGVTFCKMFPLVVQFD